MKNLLTKRNIFIAGGVVLAAIVLIWFFWPKGSTLQQGTFTEKVSRGDIRVTVSGSGVVEPIDSSAVASKVSGTIAKIEVSEGEQVEKGDLLFVLDNDSLILERDKARLTLAQARDSLKKKEAEKAKLVLTAGTAGTVVIVKVAAGDRVVSGMTVAVIQDGAAQKEVKASSEGEVKTVYVKVGDQVNSKTKILQLSPDTVNASIETLKLQVRQAELDLEQKEQNVRDLKVYAAIGGTYAGLAVSTGDSVGAGQVSSSSSSSTSKTTSQSSVTAALGSTTSSATSESSSALGTVYDQSSMKVVVAVDELDIAKIKTGQDVRVTAAAVPGKTFSGVVDAVAAEGVSSNGVSTFDVTVLIAKPGELKAGMSAEVEIEITEKKGILVLPIEAVQEENGRKFVFLASGENASRGPSGSNGTGAPANAGRRAVPVETGIHNQQYIEILSGLEEGDDVILPLMGSTQNNTGFKFGPGGSNPGSSMGSMRRALDGDSGSRSSANSGSNAR